jgi:hypothetical protein
VRQEVDHALARQRRDAEALPEIRPVVLEHIKPWRSLAHLHFNDRILHFISGPPPT